MENFWLIISSLFWFINAISSFNVDVVKPNIYNGTSGEYFGFSVALHRFSDRQKWLLVGAPLSNRTSNTNTRDRYGSVSWCETNGRKRCSIIKIDDKEPRRTDDGQFELEKKTGQWLGATLISLGNSGKIVTCAPRYILRGKPMPGRNTQSNFMLGRCFYLDENYLNVDMVTTPCYKGDEIYTISNRRWYQRMRYGYCAAGFSAALTEDGVLAMGIPGTAVWKGSITATQLNSAEQNFLFAEQKQMKSLIFGDLMGYAMTSGYFRRTDKEEIVSSAPRANGLRGKINIFDVSREEQITVSSSLPASSDKIQPGSYFGSALCAIDLNKDGFSDLLVGAPFHTVERDEGRVYVYMNNGQGALNLDKRLNGDNKIGAKFGFSIASAGDLNQDGYNDAIIGAPYEDNQGAIYVYFGSRDGIDDSPNAPRQKITPSQLQHSMKTFGYSLSGGLDVDNNGYPDIGVGAFRSDKAILLKTRPIISIQGELHLSRYQIALENNSTLCKAVDGSLHNCIDVEVCFKFNKPVRNNEEVRVSYNIELDKNRYSDVFRRVYFEDPATNEKRFEYRKTVSLGNVPNLLRCEKKPLTAFLRSANRIVDVLSAITFDLTYELFQPHHCSLCPVLDAFTGNTYRAEANFQKQCGEDKVCEPDLAVEGEIKFPGGHDALIIGFVEKMWVEIKVDNKRHDAAYPGKVVVIFPPFLGYIGPDRNKKVHCTKKKFLNGDGLQEVECVAGNPFKGKARKSFDIEFSTIGVKGNISQFFVQLKATSPSRDFDYSNNNATLNVTVRFEADLKISGSSEPDQVVFNGKGKDVTSIDEIGPQVQQYIIVRNEGPSTVDGSTVSISVPTLNDPNDKKSYLLYMISVEIQGGTCDVSTNPQHFQFDEGNVTVPVARQVSSGKKISREKRDSSIKVKEVNCEKDPSRCTTFTCHLAQLNRGDSAEIILYSRLWQSTLQKADSGPIDLVTIATVQAPNKVSERDDSNNKIKIFTRASPAVIKELKKGIPWWVILAAVLGGVLLLALIVLIMWKAGFFRRKKVKGAASSEEEMQPMNKESP